MSFFRHDKPASLRCGQRALVDAHFAAEGSKRDEERLRGHLPECDACRRRYDRLLLLSTMDPRAKSAEDRLARGLGLHESRAMRAMYFSLATASAALLAVVLMPRHEARPDSEFTSRGSVSTRPEMDRAQLLIYRVDGAHLPHELAGKMSVRDELAFGYRNPFGKKRLMVFGVDEHRHVYWYHPAWRSREENPSAVPIEGSAQARELPESIAQALDGASLTIYGVFTDEAWTVRTIEQRIAESKTEPYFEGAVTTRALVSVER